MSPGIMNYSGVEEKRHRSSTATGARLSGNCIYPRRPSPVRFGSWSVWCRRLLGLVCVSWYIALLGAGEKRHRSRKGAFSDYREAEKRPRSASPGILHYREAEIRTRAILQHTPILNHRLQMRTEKNVKHITYPFCCGRISAASPGLQISSSQPNARFSINQLRRDSLDSR